MHKRPCDQERYYGRNSREREEGSRGRNWNDDRRDDDVRSSRSSKKLRTDSSDNESHQDVQIIYKKDGRDSDKVKDRGWKGTHSRKYEQPGGSKDLSQKFATNGPNITYQRGKGLLGDAPQTQPYPYHQTHTFIRPSNEHQTKYFQYQDSSRLRLPESDGLIPKPPITSLLLSMPGSQVHNSSQVSPNSVRQAKKQKDGSWSLPPLSKKKNVDINEYDEEEPQWKSQIKELREYIVKLENEKKELVQDVETEKVQQLREYIMKIEVEKQDLQNKVDEANKGLGHGLSNDGHMIELIKKNIENVKQTQEEENRLIETKKVQILNEEKRLGSEKRKLDKAKEDLKTSLDNGMKFLSTEKRKMEMELEKKNKVNVRVNETILARIKTLENALKEEQDSRASEEKRHLASELEELETRKEMTLKTLESEAKVEELENSLEENKNELYEVKQNVAKKDSENRKLSFELKRMGEQNEELNGKLKCIQSRLNDELDEKKQEHLAQKQKLNAEYAIFVKKREDFDDSEKIRCVFCPQENLQTISSFIFHVAREHMFDQYKNKNIIDESLKVGMFLKVLEEKARKEMGFEMKRLEDSIDDMKERAFKQGEEVEERQILIKELEGKAVALERDIETLLENEANHKAQIEHLVLRNNTLQNQIRNTTVSETMRIENQEMGKKINVLGREVNDLKEKRYAIEREVDALRQRWKEESSDKLSWKNRFGEMSIENEKLRNRIEAQQNNKDDLKETLKIELVNANDEKSKLRQKIRQLEDKVDELVSLKAVAESQLNETKAENEAIKEFRCDLNAANDVVCDDMRVENKTLKSKVSSTLTELKNLKSDLSKLKTSKNFVVKELSLSEKEINRLKLELSTMKNENSSTHQKLTEALEKIHKFEKDMEICLKEQHEIVNDSSFTFDMGIDNILKAPLDVINLQIENIDIDQLENIDLENEVPVEQVSSIEKIAINEVSEVTDDSVVVAAVEIKINEKELENAQPNFEEKKGCWSDDEFDYDLLNSSQEDSEVSKVEVPHPAKCNCIDCELLKIGKEESEVLKGVQDEIEGPHRPACDCVDCDDCDVLHGYVEGKPQGIREMMRQNIIS